MDLAFACGWVAFFAYWFLCAPRARDTERRESRLSRLFHLGAWSLATMLVFVKGLWRGWLMTRFLPSSVAAEVFGFVLLVLGFAFAIQARWNLGGSWSASVAIVPQQTLVRTGPYALTRHPIYTGVLVAATGTVIANGELRSLLALLLLILSYGRKIRLEERWLSERFGAAYDLYRREVRALIPYLF